jgi:hypothetical protein
VKPHEHSGNADFTSRKQLFKKLWRGPHIGANLDFAKGGHRETGKLSTRRN